MIENALYLDGQPKNIEAAALDALTWLRFFEQKYRHGECSMTDENHIKLCRTIATLERLTAAAILGFEDSAPESPESPFKADFEKIVS